MGPPPHIQNEAAAYLRLRRLETVDISSDLGTLALHRCGPAMATSCEQYAGCAEDFTEVASVDAQRTSPQVADRLRDLVLAVAAAVPDLGYCQAFCEVGALVCKVLGCDPDSHLALVVLAAAVGPCGLGWAYRGRVASTAAMRAFEDLCPHAAAAVREILAAEELDPFYFEDSWVSRTLQACGTQTLRDEDQRLMLRLLVAEGVQVFPVLIAALLHSADLHEASDYADMCRRLQGVHLGLVVNARMLDSVHFTVDYVFRQWLHAGACLEMPVVDPDEARRRFVERLEAKDRVLRSAPEDVRAVPHGSAGKCLQISTFRNLSEIGSGRRGFRKVSGIMATCKAFHSTCKTR